MDIKDTIIQERFPTIMVPKFTTASACEMFQTRLLMGSSGLYIETQQPFASLTKLLWESPRQLPYGIVEERDEFSQLLQDEQISGILTQLIIPEAARNARQNREWAGWIVWNNQKGYSYHPLDIDASQTRVTVHRPQLPQGTSLAIDIHSHGRMSPFFSETDDHDDAGGVSLCVVLGSYLNKDGRANFEFCSRIICEGFFITPDQGGAT